MSSDYAQFVSDASSIIQLAILIVGIGRVAEMRKGFVDPTYRSRAFWSGLLMAVIAVTNATSLIPLPNGIAGSLISSLPFLAIIGVCFAFVDRTAIVGMKSDFFHRNILGWMQARIPLGAVMAGSLVCGTIALNVPESTAPSPPLWDLIGMYQISIVAAGLLGFGAVVIIIASRRTPDQTLKKNIRLLGIALGWFVLALVGFAIVPYSDWSNVVGSLLTILATYFLYLSAMSLTPLGRTIWEESK
jgi:hypothetical protein